MRIVAVAIAVILVAGISARDALADTSERDGAASERDARRAAREIRTVLRNWHSEETRRAETANVLRGIPGAERILLGIAGRYPPATIEAGDIRSQAIEALATVDRPELIARLSLWLNVDVLEGSSAARAVYRFLARMGNAEAIQSLDAFDRRRAATRVGWSHMCDGHDKLEAEVVKKMRGRRGWQLGYQINDMPCGGAPPADGYQGGVDSHGLWLRRVEKTHRSPPAFALLTAEAYKGDLGALPFRRYLVIDRVYVADGRVVIEGRAAGFREGQNAPHWRATVDPSETFRDSDADGVPDRTESILGTDPQLKDTDSDGIDDANDPLPTDGVPRDDASRIVAEVTDYLTWRRYPSEVELPGRYLQVDQVTASEDGTGHAQLRWKGDLWAFDLRRVAGRWRITEAQCLERGPVI
jgi:hypothetical protein